MTARKITRSADADAAVAFEAWKAGTGNVMEYPLSVDDPEGITIIEEEYTPHRFFRIRIDVK